MKPKTLASETVYQGRAIRVTEDRIELPNKRETTRETILHPGAVVIIPILSNGDLLLVEQYRYAVKKTLLEFPAGTLEKNEFPIDCAKREIREETGFTANSWRELGTLHPAPGICNELQHLYIAKDLEEFEQDLDEDEIIEVKTMSVEEVVQAIMDERIIDAKSISILYKARLHGLL